MSTTPILVVTEMASAQAQPHLTVNAHLRAVEQLANQIKDKDLAAPPGSPADGDAYIVAASPTGAWSGKAKYIAYYSGTSWLFLPPLTGLTVWVDDEKRPYTYDGSTWSSAIGRTWRYENDFIRTDIGTVADAIIAETASGTAAASSRLAGGISGAIGVLDLTTGTDTTGRVFVASRAADLTAFGDGVTLFRARVRLSALSDGTDTYSVRIGFQDSATDTAPVDGAWFAYTHGTNSGKWQGINSNNSTTTTVSAASAAPVANTWTTLEVVANAAGTSLNWLVDGVSIGTSTTNIPTTHGTRDFGFGAGIVKSAGTTARKLQIDFVEVEKQFTTARAA